MHFVNKINYSLSVILSLLMSMINVFLPNRLFIDAITNLDEYNLKVVSSIFNDILKIDDKVIDNKMISMGESTFNKIRSLQSMCFLNVLPIKLEKITFNQVHSMDYSLVFSSKIRKCGFFLISKLDTFIKQNASPG